MRRAENIRNFETLQQYTVCLETAYLDLFKKYKDLRAAGSAEPEWLSSSLQDQLSRLQKKFFGFGREEMVPRKDRQVGHTEEQLRLHGEHSQAEPLPENSSGITPKEFQKTLESVYYHLDERDLIMESKLRGIPQASPGNWGQVRDFFQDAVEITITERIYKKVVHRQAKYRLKDEFNTTGKEVIITAPGPAKLKAGCTYSIDFALSVVSDKYEFHIPLERQRRKMESSGLNVDVKTLYSLCQAVAEHCGPILPKIKRDIFSDFCAVHLDESPWPVLTSDSASYMWAVSNRVGSYYQFEPTRSGKVALEILSGYQGGVVTDGFSGYNRIKNNPDYRVGHCWSHARREFYERYDSYPKETENIIRLIDDLFAIEAKAKSFDELRQMRKTDSKQISQQIYTVLLETKPRFLPSEGISSAINYTLKFWPELTRFLEDLSLPMSNNDAERALRHIVMGRKNFAGSRTINGADVAATLYTVIETAKKNGLQPKEYLKSVITDRWHRRDPKSPLEVSEATIPRNTRVIFPEKDQWRVNQ